MLAKEINRRITETDPGTPAGEWLRRYWQPAALSRSITPGGQPRAIRIMGEDLVLFRDEAGRPGLLGLNCSHRLTSLGYGRLEDGGIRCPFHGWLYDIHGRCLQQPTEPVGSTFKDKIQHLSYPCEELGGLVFAYMGPPQLKPLLPRYEVLVREDGTRQADYYPINSNWLQNLEGAVDHRHARILHANRWSKNKERIMAPPRPAVETREMDFGIWRMTEGEAYGHFFMPAGFLRTATDNRGEGEIRKTQSWYVPADDAHCLRFQVGFAPLRRDGSAYAWPEPNDNPVLPGPHNDYFRDYAHIDTISGIACDAPGTTLKGLLAQDSMANETQGPIVDRTREHLGAFDEVLIDMRQMILEAIDAVAADRDPRHILRDPEDNEVVYLRGDGAMELR
jgi:phenylpropionate dioxygenase-like ring-hydroxylating dioxygenase large terminal subunit